MRSSIPILATCGAVLILTYSVPVVSFPTAAFATPRWFQKFQKKEPSGDEIFHESTCNDDPDTCSHRPTQTDRNKVKAAVSEASQTHDRIKVGYPIQPNEMHQITRPGLYGLGRPPTGHSYAIIDGLLVRYHNQTKQILSVIRRVDEIHD